MSVTLLGGGAYFYLQSSTQPEAFPTLAVEKGTIEKTSGSGRQYCSFAFECPLSRKSMALWVRCTCGVGEKVKQGQPLIKVRPGRRLKRFTDASTDLMRSEADLESAKQKLAPT